MKRFITSHIYKYAKNIMPKISETEAAALNSGTSSIAFLTVKPPRLFI